MSIHYPDWQRISKNFKETRKVRREAALFIRTAKRHMDPQKWLMATQSVDPYNQAIWYALNEIAWPEHGPSEYGPYPHRVLL